MIIKVVFYGELFFSGNKDELVDMFRIVKGRREGLSGNLRQKMIGVREYSLIGKRMRFSSAGPGTDAIGNLSGTGVWICYFQFLRCDTTAGFLQIRYLERKIIYVYPHDSLWYISVYCFRIQCNSRGPLFIYHG